MDPGPTNPAFEQREILLNNIHPSIEILEHQNMQ